MSNHLTQKFRPYFTLEELQEISSALRSSPSAKRISLIKYIDGVIYKGTNGLIQPGLTLEPSLTQKLELEDDPAIPTIPVSKQAQLQAAYDKFLSNSMQCSLKELNLAMEYRYLNSMMTKEEEQEYEKANGLI